MTRSPVKIVYIFQLVLGGMCIGVGVAGAGIGLVNGYPAADVLVLLMPIATGFLGVTVGIFNVRRCNPNA